MTRVPDRVLLVTVVSLLTWYSTLGPAAAQGSPAKPAVLVDADLVPIARIAVSVTGVLAVWQDQDGLIRRFDATGRELASVGASGEGPGEFRMMSIGGFVGESLWVSDPLLRRTTIFDAEGRLLRTQRWAHALIHAGDTTSAVLGVQPMAILPDGDYVVNFTVPAAATRPSWWPANARREVIIVAAPSGHMRRLVTVVPGDEEACRTSYPGRSGMLSIRTPYCPPSGLRKIGALFAGVLLVEQLPDDSPEAMVKVELVDLQGNTLVRRELRLARERLDSRSWRQAMEARRPPQAMPAEMRRPTEEAIAKLKKVDYRPAVDQIALGRDGTILLRLGAAERNGGRRWLMVGQTSTREVVLPARLQVYDFTADRAWGVLLDDDDLPSVVSVTLR